MTDEQRFQSIYNAWARQKAMFDADPSSFASDPDTWNDAFFLRLIRGLKAQLLAALEAPLAQADQVHKLVKENQRLKEGR